MAHSSHTKAVSINLFNLLPLLDARRQSIMASRIPNDFLLPNGKNSRPSQIINTWTFDRLTPDGNEGVGLKIAYLEHAYGTRYYVIDQANGNINAFHDNNIEGHFSPFNMNELECKVCILACLDKSTNDVAAYQQL